MAEVVRLSRSGLNVPWGFRLQGGADFNQRLVVQKVTADGIASRAQMTVGDVLIKIGDAEASNLTHKQACDLIGSAKLQLELTLVGQHNVHKLRLGSDHQTPALPPASPVRPQPSAAETSGQAWVPSSELRRRASSGLTSPLSPRVPRHAPWEPAPTQPVAVASASHAERAAFPPPPPSLAAISASGLQPSSVGPTLGAQLARLQLKSAHDESGFIQQQQQQQQQPPKVTYQSTFTSFLPAYHSAGAAQRQPAVATAAAAAAAPASAAIAARAAAPYGGAASRAREATADRPAVRAGDASEARRGSAASTFSGGGGGGGGRAFGQAVDVAPTGGARRPSSLEYPENPVTKGPQSPNGKDSPDVFREAPASPLPKDGALSPGGSLRQRRDSQNSDGGGGGGRAYLIQPNGLVASVQWNERPPPPDIQNSAVLAALKEEQAELKGGPVRRRSSGSSKHGLSFRVLQLITGTMEEDEDNDDGAISENRGGSPGATATSPGPASPTGSVFSTSPKEGPMIGARGYRRTWSTSQDDYSDF